MMLDTCALLFLAQGGGKLSQAARDRIDAAPSVYVSAITGFEIGIKHRKGKLVLPARPVEWVQAVLEHHNVEVVPIDIRIALAATELPDIHNDPCDRIIIATAKLFALPVVTTDAIYSRYGLETVS